MDCALAEELHIPAAQIANKNRLCLAAILVINSTVRLIPAHAFPESAKDLCWPCALGELKGISKPELHDPGIRKCGCEIPEAGNAGQNGVASERHASYVETGTVG